MDEKDNNKTNTERKAEEIAKALLKEADKDGISTEEKESLQRRAQFTLSIAKEFSNFIRSQKN